MSDLYSRTASRHPIASSSHDTSQHAPRPSTSPAVRTPRDIMKDRQEREARRKAEADEVKRKQEEERRYSAERRTQAPGIAPTSSASRRAAAYDNITSAPERGHTELRGSTQQPARVGHASHSPNTQFARDELPSIVHERSDTSAFPHAFERWERLSSQWEGLTSYWIRKLETHQESIAQSVPTAANMARQITDLSAAGANLFHAVVELQRLRASSERKFQRWFLETRAEQEKDRESRAELDQALLVEREARAGIALERERADRERKESESLLRELRRELTISKEEARRAWEELGRREQTERDLTTRLREGMPSVVGGIRVVPTAGLGTGSISQSGGQPLDPYGDQAYHDNGRPISTDTDPFTEAGYRHAEHSLHHEPELPNLNPHQLAVYGRGGSATSSSVHTAIPISAQAEHHTQAPTRYDPPARPAPTTVLPEPPSTAPSRAAVQASQDLYREAPSSSRTGAQRIPSSDLASLPSQSVQQQQQQQQQQTASYPARQESISPTAAGMAGMSEHPGTRSLASWEVPSPPSIGDDVEVEEMTTASHQDQLHSLYHPTRLSNVPEEEEGASRSSRIL